MQRLTERAHEICVTVLQSGEIAIDATAGNGHDTLFLAQQVGPAGMVFALDVQADALQATARRLEADSLQNVVLLHRDHAEIADAIPAEQHGRVAVVMFNLGYLPGGDKSRTTQSATTRTALKQSLRLLQPGGLLTVLAYTGHPGGKEETVAVRSFCVECDQTGHDIDEITAGESHASPPVLFVVRKR